MEVMSKPKSARGSKLPVPRKATTLEREPTPYVLPPNGTRHTDTNINVEWVPHLIIREIRKLIVALVLLTLFVVAAVFGS